MRGEFAAKRFLPRVVVRGHRFVRPKRARFFERDIFFFFLAFSRGGDDDDDDDEGPTKPKTKISAKEKRREFFF
jgi:hypothetical protein